MAAEVLQQRRTQRCPRLSGQLVEVVADLRVQRLGAEEELRGLRGAEPPRGTALGCRSGLHAQHSIRYRPCRGRCLEIVQKRVRGLPLHIVCAVKRAQRCLYLRQLPTSTAHFWSWLLVSGFLGPPNPDPQNNRFLPLCMEGQGFFVEISNVLIFEHILSLISHL